MNPIEWLLVAAAWDVWNRPAEAVPYPVLVAAAMIFGRSGAANAVKLTNELRRVLALPRREPGDYTELAEELTELLKTPNGTMKLRPVQALALHDIGINRGGFLPSASARGRR
jgi:hypothetical protein